MDEYVRNYWKIYCFVRTQNCVEKNAKSSFFGKHLLMHIFLEYFFMLSCKFWTSWDNSVPHKRKLRFSDFRVFCVHEDIFLRHCSCCLGLNQKSYFLKKSYNSISYNFCLLIFLAKIIEFWVNFIAFCILKFLSLMENKFQEVFLPGLWA